MGKKILVADDSVTIQKVIKLALSSDGYEIQTVNDGTDALKLIESYHPDLVLIDISLPQFDAFTIKKMCAENSATANIGFILMVSAFERPDEAQIQHLHFQGRLIKPFDPAHLRKVVTSAFVKIAELQPAANSARTSFEEPTLSVSSFSGLPVENPPPVSNDLDIQGLTSSTIKMSKLDELDWNLDDSKNLKQTEAMNPPAPPPPIPNAAPKQQAKPAFDLGSTKQIDDGNSTFLNHVLTPKKEVLKEAKKLEPKFDLNVSEDLALVESLPPIGPIDPITTIASPPPPPKKVTVDQVREQTREMSKSVLRAAQEPLTKAVSNFTYETSTPSMTRAEIEQLVRKELGDFLSRFAREEMPRIAEDVIRKEIEKILQEA